MGRDVRKEQRHKHDRQTHPSDRAQMSSRNPCILSHTHLQESPGLLRLWGRPARQFMTRDKVQSAGRVSARVVYKMHKGKMAGLIRGGNYFAAQTIRPAFRHCQAEKSTKRRSRDHPALHCATSEMPSSSPPSGRISLTTGAYACAAARDWRSARYLPGSEPQ